MLFEHKSYLDKKVGFQLLKTMVMLWDRLLNPRKKTKGTQRGSEHTETNYEDVETEDTKMMWWKPNRQKHQREEPWI